MLGVGVIGYGYWGPNIVRNFDEIPGVGVIAVSDLKQNALKQVKKNYPEVIITRNYKEILFSPDIHAVAIVTPVLTHYEIAKLALQNGKHVFIEKPLTTSAALAEELIELAYKKNLKIMVDHTFLFTGAVKKIKELIDDGTLGDLYYFDSIRINLGLFQKDINVVWDLAPHDLSIIDHLITKKPTAITATGISHFNNELENVAYITLYFPGAMIAHINVSWLAPVKMRTTLIGGHKKMLVWNDLVTDQKLRVYDRGVEPVIKRNSHNIRVNYRSGDMWAPQVEQVEALKSEAEYFVGCILDDKPIVLNDGSSGLRVIKMLEAIVKSLKRGGELVYM